MKWTNKISKKDFILLACALFLFPIVIFYTVNSDSFETRTRAESEPTLPDSISFADLNSDSQISIADFSIWLNYYYDYTKNGKYNASGDFNGDGKLSIADFSKWVEAYISYVKGIYKTSKRDNPIVVKENPNYSENDKRLVIVENAKGDVYFSIDTDLTALNYETAGSTVIPTGNDEESYSVYWYCTGNDNYYSARGVTIVNWSNGNPVKPSPNASYLLIDNEITLAETDCVGGCPGDPIWEDETNGVIIESRQTMCTQECRSGYRRVYSISTFGNKNITKDKIEKVYTVKETTVPTDAKESWDVSEKKDKSIIAYVLDKDSNGMYELYLGQDGGVFANPDSSRMFENYTSLTYADLTNLHTDYVTDMTLMFKNANKLKQLLISGWNTSSVTNMKYMFKDCESLTSLNLNHFDTSSVKDMEGIFFNCKSLKALEIDKFDMSNVTSIMAMFMECNKLAELSIGNWNTANITNMNSLFANCESLSNISIGNWDTSNVLYMTAMFADCKSLSSIDIEDWNVSNVEDIAGLFTGCASLKSISLNKWKISNVTSLAEVFSGCTSLTDIKISNWDTSNVSYEGMHGMFEDCTSLKELDLGNWNTSNVEDLGFMFWGCSSLSSLNISNWNTKKVIYMWDMFNDCSSLSSLDLSGWSSDNVRWMSSMFEGCSSLKTIYVNKSFLANIDTSDFNQFSGSDMFKDCTSLVGGNGTKYSSSHVDGEYAKIDTASNPGYFTEK